METFENVNDILDFAIKNEQEAVEFYSNLAKTVTNQGMRDTFEKFAQEEMNHKAKLLKVKNEGVVFLSKEKVLDLKISDYIVKATSNQEMTYEEALIVAMDKEKSAFKLYSNLAIKTNDATLRDLFLSLAQEESKHKLSFEIEYDEFVLREN